jgi:hypothetical protein
MTPSRKSPVGYKNPPLQTRFKPGQSGNPRGRPKKTSVASELITEFNRKVTVRENGVEQKTSKAAALAKSLVARALSGDMRAIGYLIRLLRAQFQAPTEAIDTHITEADAAALERFIGRRLAAINETNGSEPPPEDITPRMDSENE